MPVAVWLIQIGEFGWAFWLFVLAGVSDAVDGFIARAFGARTILGGYLDPLADKALLVSVYVALGWAGHLPSWLVILVVFRDIVIIGGVLLLYTLKESFAMQPSWTSKVNTVAQISLAAAVLAINGLGINDRGVADVLVWVTGATTAISGFGYIIQGSRMLNRFGGLR